MANTAGQATALSVLSPIRPERLESLEATLAALPLGEQSPLARVGTTHFARWVVIGQLVYEGGGQKPDTLSSPYLLFTSNFDGPLDEYLEDLSRRSFREAHAVWSHCIGFPRGRAPEQLIDYLMSHRVDTTMFYSAYPKTTVAHIRESLALRRRFGDFVTRSQALDPSTLMRAFRSAFGGSPS